MTNLSVKYVGGWPIVEPLGAKEAKIRDQNMIQGERVLGQVVGNYGQAVIATTHKVLVVKTGMMAGQTFGGKATSFDYRNIMGVEVRTGFIRGEFEVIVGGLPTPRGNRSRDRVKAAESPNAIIFDQVNQKVFQMIAAQIRMMAGQLPAPVGHSTATAGPPQAAAPNQASSQVPIPEQIRQLAELHAAGILTDVEFAAKKAELLRRM
jgi:putative oligomerization/nucleic acid binding protein